MKLSDLTLPALTINAYLWHVMTSIDPTFTQPKNYGAKIPFFPISDAASGTKSWENKTYVIYDRILKSSRNSFYPIKNEHLMYYIKGNEQGSLEWSMAIQYILDRMDDAAQDINSWNAQQEDPAKVYFHHLKVYQTNDSVSREFSNRPYYITTFIVEAEYHLTDSIDQYL